MVLDLFCIATYRHFKGHFSKVLFARIIHIEIVGECTHGRDAGTRRNRGMGACPYTRCCARNSMSGWAFFLATNGEATGLTMTFVSAGRRHSRTGNGQAEQKLGSRLQANAPSPGSCLVSGMISAIAASPINATPASPRKATRLP